MDRRLFYYIAEGRVDFRQLDTEAGGGVSYVWR